METVVSQHKNNQRKTGLYRYVFDCTFTKYVGYTLSVSFLLQPVVPVYASEIGNEENDVVIEQIQNDSASSIQDEHIKDENQSETEQNDDEEVTEIDSSDAVQAENKLPTTTDGDDNPNGGEQSAVSIDSSLISEDEIVIDETDEHDSQVNITAESMRVEIVASTTPNASTTGVIISKSDVSSSSTEQTSSSTDWVHTSHNQATSSQNVEESKNYDIASTSKQQQIEEVTTQGIDHIDERENDKITIDESKDIVSTSSIREITSSSTVQEEISETEEEIVSIVSTVTNDTNRYQFGADECTSVGNDSFYCSNTGSAPEYEEDGVFAVFDANGDKEIMIRLDGKEVFLTDNNTDDAAPYYDAVSDRIVWHSLQNDRYQIAMYDFNTDDIEYLTDNSYNNMEPVVSEDIVLWQAWIANNWEIMMYQDEEVRQVTHNTVHDVAPRIRGGYVLWQTQFSDGWQIAMYDIDTDTIEYISESNGARTENPRFVLVYDSLSENGDVETFGYDLDSKTNIPLSKIPAKLPKNLPEPDSTGETKALIQNKSSIKENEVVTTTPTKGTGGSGNGTATTSGSTTTATTSRSDSIPDVVIDSAETVVPTVSENASNTDPVLNEQISHIPDVIIATTTQESDSGIE